jgi:pilus assembly protein CpaF
MTSAGPVERRLVQLLTREPGAGRDELVALVRAEDPLASGELIASSVDAVLGRAAGLGPLAPLLADPSLTEIMVNGPGPVWVERDGRLERSDVEVTSTDLTVLVERILTPLGLRVDRTSPMVDARLPDGSRVNVVVPPLAIDGPCVTIRRFGTRGVPLTSFCREPALVDALIAAVHRRLTVLVVGATGAGKTTFLNALAAHLPPGERLVTVEDTAELRLPGDHVVRLEARPANAEGVGAVTIRQLVRNALRMRPDRLIVGEVRGGEALDLLQALNTGHEGSLSTCHANGTTEALRRLETLVLLGGVDLPLSAVRDQIESAVDLVVLVARRGPSRLVVEVAEVVRADDRVIGRSLWPGWAQPERPRVIRGWRRP